MQLLSRSYPLQCGLIRVLIYYWRKFSFVGMANHSLNQASLGTVVTCWLHNLSAKFFTWVSISWCMGERMFFLAIIYLSHGSLPGHTNFFDRKCNWVITAIGASSLLQIKQMKDVCAAIVICHHVTLSWLHELRKVESRWISGGVSIHWFKRYTLVKTSLESLLPSIFLFIYLLRYASDN